MDPNSIRAVIVFNIKIDDKNALGQIIKNNLKTDTELKPLLTNMLVARSNEKDVFQAVSFKYENFNLNLTGVALGIFAAYAGTTFYEKAIGALITIFDTFKLQLDYREAYLAIWLAKANKVLDKTLIFKLIDWDLKHNPSIAISMTQEEFDDTLQSLNNKKILIIRDKGNVELVEKIILKMQF